MLVAEREVRVFAYLGHPVDQFLFCLFIEVVLVEVVQERGFQEWVFTVGY